MLGWLSTISGMVTPTPSLNWQEEECWRWRRRLPDSCIPVFRSSVNAAAVYVRIGNLEGKLTGISFKSQAQHDQG
ncbi:hypothetical protein ACQKI4_19170, partial [Paenibacillus glucanolyticus]|uniref:hypothetical protein n=1 Tax=Paenibacillus glucanolyticus TaxID=59843 RepID=UPI003D08AFB9